MRGTAYYGEEQHSAGTELCRPLRVVIETLGSVPDARWGYLSNLISV